MANIKSAKKRARKSQEQRLHNKAIKTNVKTNIKKFYAAVDSGDKSAAQEALNVAQKKLDKAAAKHVIHKNKAANKKSQLAKAFNQM